MPPFRPKDSAITLMDLETPRPYVVKRVKGDDSKDQGDKRVVKTQVPKGPSMAEKWRAHKDAPNGFQTKTSFSYLRQGTIDEYGLTNLDQENNTLEFFTPRKFKDAEAVAFNGKTLTSAGYKTVTTAANGYTFEDVYITKSQVTFTFHNISQRRTTVEMYICYGKNGEGTTSPILDLNGSYDMYNGNSGTITAATLYFDPMKNKEWNDLWKVTKVVITLEQGEHQNYLLKGPQHYIMDPKTHVNNGTTPADTTVNWQLPYYPGNGCYIFFRMLNDICLLGNNDAGTTTNILMGRKIGAHHPINPIPATDGDQQSCVICKMTEYIQVKAPNTDQEGIDQRNFLNSFHTLAGSTYTETNVDTDQAMTIPSSFV